MCAVGEVFTDIAFEHSPQLLPISTRRVYVGTFSGALYQVNIDSRAVEAVYQVFGIVFNSCVACRLRLCLRLCCEIGMVCGRVNWAVVW
jgi:hypothetical protein